MLHIGRNIFSLLLSRIVTAIILLLVYTRLIQYLGPESAGQYGLLAGYLTVFAFFVDLGMQQLVIKKVSENKAEASKYLTNYFGIQFLLGVGFMVLMDVIVINANYPPLVTKALFVTGLGMLLSSMTMPFMAIINAFQKLSIIAWVNFANSAINAAMMLVVVMLHKSIFFLAFVPVVVSGFDILIYAIVVHRNFAKFKFTFDKIFWKQLLVWNAPFMLLTIFSIYNRIDTLILPHLRSFTENGYYTAVYKFWDTLAFLPAVVAAALYPYYAEKVASGEMEEVRKVLKTYTRYMIALAAPVAVGAYLLADKLTVAFFGQPFAPAAPALWLLVVAVAILFIYIPVNSLIISQKTKLAMIITGCTLFFNLAANLILIPKFGFVVAALITLISEIAQLIGYTWIVQRKIISFEYFPSFVKPIIASLIMGAVVFYFQHYNLWLVIGLGGLVYGISLLSLKFFHKQDWELIRHSIGLKV